MTTYEKRAKLQAKIDRAALQATMLQARLDLEQAKLGIWKRRLRRMREQHASDAEVTS